MKNLHFSLCFSGELEHEWRISSLNRNGQWPFDNVKWYIDERRIYIDYEVIHTTKTFLIVYKRPIHLVLQHARTLHNHRLAQHASVPIKTDRHQFLQWTCDQIEKSDQILDTLRVIASNHADKLQLKYLVKPVEMSNLTVRISTIDVWCVHFLS